VHRAVAGELPPKSGSIVRGKNTAVAYVDQSRSGLVEEDSIQENVAGRRGEVQWGDELIDVRTYLARFLFDRDKIRQPVGALSGGERARVLLAKLLLERPNLLLLDEPTNDLDVATLSALEEMILAFEGTTIVVTHDRYFLDRVATAILAFDGRGAAVRYPGNFSTYLALRREAPSTPTESARPKERPLPEKAPAKGLTYAERLEFDAIMQQIETAEGDVAALEAGLAMPSSDHVRIAELARDLAQKKADLDILLVRWAELEGKRG
jgi:ATP-binding cassette subfamily F protein uup